MPSIIGNNTSSTVRINPNEVMRMDGQAITPWNPGDNSEIRTHQVVAKHKNFTKDEADKLRVQAATRTRQAKNNRQAYNALRKIENADAQDQQTYRQYQTTVAKTSASKKSADVGKAKTLYGLTGTYAKMGLSLGEAANEAQVKVAEYQALYSDVSRRWN
ncbi:MAG: hypothetical protein HC769_25520 [Cyanobacteria bacterium CRU_2_1]|nr:hypothetical protein [Cyanobacteria bacterium RU_5_0]NJR61892.1 hypothetical protein [Cyanobacteria bacterium CRU_2_1]